MAGLKQRTTKSRGKRPTELGPDKTWKQACGVTDMGNNVFFLAIDRGVQNSNLSRGQL